MSDTNHSNTLEARFASLWVELLEVAEVASQDNFIEMGGNSLLATILATRFEEATGIALELQDVFQLTFGDLMARINE